MTATSSARGLFIVFEGIDGAGKTTQSSALAAFLQRHGIPTVRSKEPTDGPWGMKIRRSASTGRMPVEEELQAFIEDRREHVQSLIAPSLDEGKVVILDRYYYSTIAYQSIAGMDHDEITRMMTGEFPRPDVAVLIDVPAEVGLSRVTERDSRPNEFESVNNLRPVRDMFKLIAKEHTQFITINGTLPIKAVEYAIARKLLDGVLKSKFCAKSYGCEDPAMCGYRLSGTCLWAAMCRSAAETQPDLLSVAAI